MSLEEKQKTFCKKCGLKINTSFLAHFRGIKFYEFEDGIYCERCAKLKVDYARR